MIQETLLQAFMDTVKYHHPESRYESLLNSRGQCSNLFHRKHILQILFDLLKYLPSATPEEKHSKTFFIRKALSDTGAFVKKESNSPRARIIDASVVLFQTMSDGSIASQTVQEGEVSLEKDVYSESELPFRDQIGISTEYEGGHLSQPFVITLTYPRTRDLLEFIRIFVPLGEESYPHLDTYHEDCYEPTVSDDDDDECHHPCSLQKFTL